MKVNQLLTIYGIRQALFLSAGKVSAQNDNGGGRWRRWHVPGGAIWTPAQMQQRMMDNVKDQLGYTNDTEWNAIPPLVQKVMDARRDVGVGGGIGPLVPPRATTMAIRAATTAAAPLLYPSPPHLLPSSSSPPPLPLSLPLRVRRDPTALDATLPRQRRR